MSIVHYVLAGFFENKQNIFAYESLFFFITNTQSLLLLLLLHHTLLKIFFLQCILFKLH